MCSRVRVDERTEDYLVMKTHPKAKVATWRLIAIRNRGSNQGAKSSLVGMDGEVCGGLVQARDGHL